MTCAVKLSQKAAKIVAAVPPIAKQMIKKSPLVNSKTKHKRLTKSHANQRFSEKYCTIATII